MKEIIRFTVGDWSDDGHGQHDHVLVESSHSVTALQEAYFKSCAKIGYRFDHGSYNLPEEHTELPSLLTKYGDDNIPPYFMDIMKKKGYDLDMLIHFEYDRKENGGIQHVTPEDVIPIILWVISISMPSSWEFKIVEPVVLPQFNGYWDNNLNVQLGYGSYLD